ncbi:site-specific integrase [Nocardioides glacieisoli]|uniref:Site-specific integrase n=1 Tax=Nocardioides glacieisoli TaxID=1168730 RepID=A0A4Q2RMY2_9ACTN|nr:site-specific integrase [Nocardioides glacieisoli]RYB88965.1 site-specific integrase [Nocardioides glacieisoli]
MVNEQRRTRRGFGRIEKLASGRYRAGYTGPDGRLYRGPVTFGARDDAIAWLSARRAEIEMEVWAPDVAARGAARRTAPTMRAYGDLWLETRKTRGRELRPTTRQQYRMLLDKFIYPTFGDERVDRISADDVNKWYDALAPGRETIRAQAYSLLRTIFTSAATERPRAFIPYNPAHIRGAGNTKRVHKVRPASLQELETIVDELPTRYQLMALLAAWCAMRFGELAELRRGDIDLRTKQVKIRRAVVRADGQMIVGLPKTDAGIRDVAIPPHLLPLVSAHLKDYTGPGKDALLFSAAADHDAHMAPSTLYKVYYPARKAAGREDLRWHDLRHTGAVLAAQTGATLAELMGRLGHSTPGAAMRYQHAAADRDTEIAKRLSALVGVRGEDEPR